MKIAVLGMGRMGRSLAGRLIENGHDVVIWNRTPGKAPELVDRGASEATRIGEAVAGADLAITFLANDDAVRSIALGDLGIKDSLPPGATYVDSSTVSPDLSEELAGSIDGYVAMPILGAPAAVEDGKATYLVGGTSDRVTALFPALAEKAIHYDTPALATAAKLAVNVLLVAGISALAESFAVARAGGLGDEQLRELVGSSPMLAPGLRNRFEGVLTGRQETWWGADLAAKDARLALELAEKAGGSLPLLSTVKSQLDRLASGHEGEDIATVGKLYRH